MAVLFRLSSARLPASNTGESNKRVFSRIFQPALRGGFFISAIWAISAVSGLIAAVWLLFAPALPGIVQFDDLGNLSGLSSIANLHDAWAWIGGGRAGPLGRPLALMTFALQYYQWPDPEAFLQWNIALHSINALLVFWLAQWVANRLKGSEKQSLVIGFFVALVWAVLPLLNTSVLFIVQRMTLLSGTFTLAGLIAYVKLRGTACPAWRRQCVALLVLAGFGVLALLSKESGALIVVYAMVLELLLLSTDKLPKSRTAFSMVALGAACAVLLLALLRHADWSACTELQRGFTAVQRLGGEGSILVLYIKNIFLPVSANLNPYQSHSIPHAGLPLYGGMVVWFALMLGPFITWLRGWRMAALVLAWFCYGHIVESGWVALEPYFAHRNYLPALSLVFAFVYGVYSIGQNKRLWRGVFLIYLMVLCAVSWVNTSLWGHRTLAAEIWAKEQPLSFRSQVNLGYELERTQNLGAALLHFDRFLEKDKNSVGVRLLGLISACILDPDTDHSDRIHATEDAIATLPYEGWATDSVQKLMEKVQSGQCPGVSKEQVAAIAAAFLSAKPYQCSPSIAHNMLWMIALVASQNGDTRGAMELALRALKESMSYSMASFYLDLAKKQGTRADLESLRDLVAKAPVPAGTSHEEWKNLLNQIDQQLSMALH